MMVNVFLEEGDLLLWRSTLIHRGGGIHGKTPAFRLFTHLYPKHAEPLDGSLYQPFCEADYRKSQAFGPLLSSRPSHADTAGPSHADTAGPSHADTAGLEGDDI